MKNLISIFSVVALLVVGIASAEETRITAKAVSLSGKNLKFISHQGPGAFDNALAMNTGYKPIQEMRPVIEKVIGRPLSFLKSWDANGEAHITTITPPEYHQVLSAKLSMNEIDAIAKRFKIQQSDIKVFGIGSAKVKTDGKDEETFFVLVDSLNLRKIRLAIYEEFVRKGGEPSAWDPTWFFPHITIGYTKRDLHETDGVVKNLKHSFDTRFFLQVQN